MNLASVVQNHVQIFLIQGYARFRFSDERFGVMLHCCIEWENV